MAKLNRNTVSVVLIVVGAVLLVAGAAAFYAREQVIDRQAFADRAVTALGDDEVRVLVGREIVTYAVERGSADLVAARPLLESVVGTLVETEPFRRVFHAAATEANRTFFDRDRENVLFDLGDATEIVEFGLRSVNPELADQLPQELQPALLTLRRRDFAGTTLRVADEVRVFGILLPLLALLALLAFAGAVAVARDRRVAVLRAGVSVAAAGALLAIALLVLRSRILAGAHGEDELTDEEARGAVGGMLDAFLGDLLVWALLLGLLGAVIGAAAAALDPETVGAPARKLRRMGLRPRTAWARALRGAAALGLGIFVVLNPTLATQVAAIVVGAFLAFLGVAELLAPLGPAGASRAGARQGRSRALAGAGAVGAVLVAGVVALLIAVTGSDREPGVARAAAPAGSCNGAPGLCELRLNEAVFAGTHNSFSAADSSGWFIANQRRTIPRQLADGIRLFLLDAHWGVEGADGKVRTDFEAEGRSRNKVAEALPPDVLQAAERLAGRIGVRSDADGERDVWLCHTVCELGAVPMSDVLADIGTFLEANRREVVILFIEPYVPPAEIARTFERAGLDRHVATLDRDEPLPTLGELVRADRRVIVLAEQDADGTVPWYLDGFSFVQDTPLGAQTVDALTCALERGDAGSPMLMLNHWADVFPPQRTANQPFQTKREIVRRAHECESERGLPMSLIAVDHYDQGALVEAVGALNEERIRKHRRTQAAGRSG